MDRNRVSCRMIRMAFLAKHSSIHLPLRDTLVAYASAECARSFHEASYGQEVSTRFPLLERLQKESAER